MRGGREGGNGKAVAERGVCHMGSVRQELG